MTDEQIIGVVKAHMEGKQIQVKHRCCDEWVDDIRGPDWDFLRNDYRVKPEPRKPREWWIHKGNYLDREKNLWAVEQYEPVLPNCCDPIHVREVIE